MWFFKWKMSIRKHGGIGTQDTSAIIFMCQMEFLKDTTIGNFFIFSRQEFNKNNYSLSLFTYLFLSVKVIFGFFVWKNSSKLDISSKETRPAFVKCSM